MPRTISTLLYCCQSKTANLVSVYVCRTALYARTLLLIAFIAGKGVEELPVRVTQPVQIFLNLSVLEDEIFI
jgi:hypothetical protein